MFNVAVHVTDLKFDMETWWKEMYHPEHLWTMPCAQHLYSVIFTLVLSIVVNIEIKR